MPEITLTGIAASEGIALGPAYVYHPVDLTIPTRSPGSAADEMGLFDQAVATAAEELAEIQQRMAARADEETAAIFEAHAMMLEDPSLRSGVEEAVNNGAIIERAVLDATESIAQQFAAMDNEYFAERAADVRDVGRRLLRLLLGIEDHSLAAVTEPSVIVAQDLTPSDTASLQPENTLALCTAVGGLTSHTAILARTLGIPAVVGLGDELLKKVTTGTTVVMDGIGGQVIANPKKKTKKEYTARQEAFTQRQAELIATAHELAYTADGQRVEVGANVGDAKTAAEAVEMGAEGVGLLRTEFLYLNDTTPPSEDKQIEVYRAVFEAMDGRPVIVRTLDIGGDKPPTYIDFPDELNPFLGWRAIRICLDQPVLFKTQLRAILRAADGHEVLIMYPMINGVAELMRANAVFDEVVAELNKEGVAFNPDVPVGIMVETPGAAMMVDKLAEYCAFFSIGTNDLTQYTLAVDRTNERIAPLYESFHPAVLRLIEHTIRVAHEHDVWVGMCGELAGMPHAIPILLGFGLDEFSMAGQAIPSAKWLLGKLTTEQAREIADHVLTLGTADEVTAYMDDILAELQAV